MEYSKYLEDRRHNQATEDTERFKAGETARHNVQTEGLTASQQKLDVALANLDLQGKIYTADAKLLGERLKTAAQNYKTDVEKWAKENSLKIDAAKANATINKTNAEIRKITEEVKKVAADATLSDAKKREIEAKLNGDLTLMRGQLIQGLSDAAGSYRAASEAADAAGVKITQVDKLNTALNIARGDSPKTAAKKVLQDKGVYTKAQQAKHPQINKGQPPSRHTIQQY
jgi:hypothetical protein